MFCSIRFRAIAGGCEEFPSASLGLWTNTQHPAVAQ